MRGRDGERMRWMVIGLAAALAYGGGWLSAIATEPTAHAQPPLRTQAWTYDCDYLAPEGAGSEPVLSDETELEAALRARDAQGWELVTASAAPRGRASLFCWRQRR